MSEVKRIIDSCKRRVEGEAMPSCISKQIFEQLQETFPNFLSKRFTVRSSCADEGLEDMCATSQMETFLGVKGEKEVGFVNNREICISFIFCRFQGD